MFGKQNKADHKEIWGKVWKLAEEIKGLRGDINGESATTTAPTVSVGSGGGGWKYYEYRTTPFTTNAPAPTNIRARIRALEEGVPRTRAEIMESVIKIDAKLARLISFLGLEDREIPSTCSYREIRKKPKSKPTKTKREN